MLTFQNISNGKKYLGCMIRKIKKTIEEVGNWSLAIEPLVLMVPSIHYCLCTQHLGIHELLLL